MEAKVSNETKGNGSDDERFTLKKCLLLKRHTNTHTHNRDAKMMRTSERDVIQTSERRRMTMVIVIIVMMMHNNRRNVDERCDNILAGPFAMMVLHSMLLSSSKVLIALMGFRQCDANITYKMMRKQHKPKKISSHAK